jgi:hypothetical protein
MKSSSSKAPRKKSNGISARSRAKAASVQPETASAGKPAPQFVVSDDVSDLSDNRAHPGPLPQEKNKPGRPAELTFEKVQAVSDNIALGMPEEEACFAEDVSYDAFKKALQRKPEWKLAQRKAQAQFMKGALLNIAAGNPGWQGGAWILERRHKPHFSRNDISIQNTNLNVFELSPEDTAIVQRHAREMFATKRN